MEGSFLSSFAFFGFEASASEDQFKTGEVGWNKPHVLDEAGSASLFQSRRLTFVNQVCRDGLGQGRVFGLERQCERQGESEALDLLKHYADGDGRRFLNLVDQVASAASGAGLTAATAEFAKSSTSPSLRRFDKGGDELYMQLSAFHKSLRGSQPDAALYWMARILDGGGDGRQVARRMLAMASEDSQELLYTLAWSRSVAVAEQLTPNACQCAQKPFRVGR